MIQTFLRGTVGTPSNLRYDAGGVEAIHRQLGGNVESADWLDPVTPKMPNHRLTNEPVAFVGPPTDLEFIPVIAGRCG